MIRISLPDFENTYPDPVHKDKIMNRDEAIREMTDMVNSDSNLVFNGNRIIAYGADGKIGTKGLLLGLFDIKLVINMLYDGDVLYVCGYYPGTFIWYTSIEKKGDNYEMMNRCYEY